MRHVNYDQIASKYNQRYRDNPLGGIEKALVRLIKGGNIQSVIEIGCGTGRWLAGIAHHFPEAHLYGLDYSRGMLTEAQGRSESPELIRGKASQLPLKAGSFDLVFCVNALHHFDDPQEFVAQAQELLEAGGTLAIIGQVPHDRRNRWYIYDYFENIYETDLQRFPTWAAVMDWMVIAGFHQIHWEPVEWISDDKIGWSVLEDPFLQKHATSQLALLDDKAYAAGIEKIKTALKSAETQGEKLIFKAQLRLDMLTGVIPKDD
jgi:ubiquinone/menaquinone biosynthesis C-methylase UbiE